jgi:flagellar motor switch protein FliM
VIELDVLVENKRIVDPVILELEGKPKLLGKLGQMREKRAVMISGPVEDEDL